jgi:hypothetical protein
VRAVKCSPRRISAPVECSAPVEFSAVERRGGSAEKQEWKGGRKFGGRIVVEKKEEALRTAKEWDRPDTVWTDGSR